MKYNIRYTSEYILKLQIHQHSLLTRKVFSWHSSLAKVFITRSLSKLDHHQRWIVIITTSAISSKWCYLSILLVIGSSTEPALFHVGCRPNLHVGLHLLQHLYLTMGGTHPTTMSKWPSTYIQSWEEHIPQPYKKGLALISNHGRNTSCNHVGKALHLHLTMGGTYPTTMSERLRTYIWPWEECIQQPC